MDSPLYQPFPMLPGRRAQLWQHQPQFRRPRHFHEEPELNIVLRGTARVGVGERVLDLGLGDTVFLHPGQDHVLLEASADLDLFVMALTPDLAARIGARAPDSSQTLTLIGRELEATARLLPHLRDVKDATAIESELGDIFSHASERFTQVHVASRRALASVREDLGLSGSDLARRVRVSPSELSRKFHRDLGVPLVEYRARLRLMRFIQLVDGGTPLGRAALEADFGSYAQCHRVFGRTLDCAPRDYFSGLRSDIDARVWASP